MNKKIAIVFAALGFAAVAYGALSTASNAQSPAKESMEQKVVRLEKEVSDLRKEVVRLKSSAHVFTFSDVNPQIGRAAPQPGTPFGFNGQTYYYVPLNENPSVSDAAVRLPGVETNFLNPTPQ